MAVVTTNRKNIFGRTKSLTYNASTRKKSKSSQKSSSQRAFLTYKFQSLPVFDVVSKGETYGSIYIKNGESSFGLGKVVSSISEGLPVLEQEAEAYCRANGGMIPQRKECSALHRLKTLYDSMTKCCPHGHSIYIDHISDENHIRLIECVDVEFPYNTVFFIPVSFIGTLNGEYRQFFIEFMSFLQVTCCVSFPEDHMDFTYALGMWDDSIIEDKVDEDPDYAKFIDLYLKGMGAELFSKIAYANYNRFESPTEEDLAWWQLLLHDAPSSELKDLIYSAIEGANLMRGKSFNNYRQLYNSDDDYDEFLPIERIMAFCYKDVEEDPVAEFALDCLSNDGYNYCQEELQDNKIITTSYDKPFVGSNFPSKWVEWYLSFDKARMKYEQTNKDDK